VGVISRAGTGRRGPSALLALAVGASLSACAAPRITLTPRFPDGEVRIYRLVADARTVIDAPGIDAPGIGSGERTVLRADVRIRLGRSAGSRTATLTFTPTGFERDGTQAEPPAEQSAEIVFDDTGRVESVTAAGDGSVPFGGSPDDIGTIFGSTIARGPARIAQRWSEPLADGTGRRRSRVAALRWVGGYRCAVVESATSRPVERVREAGGSTIRLIGTETALVESAFAFDNGFPVRVKAVASGVFDIAGAPGQGTVTIESTTTMTLLDREIAAPRPTATATATARNSRRPARS